MGRTSGSSTRSRTEGGDVCGECERVDGCGDGPADVEAGSESVFRREADSVERTAGGDGSAGECACELEWRSDAVQGVWAGADVDREWSGEVRDVLSGWGGVGLCGSAILRDGGGVSE